MYEAPIMHEHSGFIVTMKDPTEKISTSIKRMSEGLGVKIASSRDFSDKLDREYAETKNILLNDSGVLLLSGGEESMAWVSTLEAMETVASVEANFSVFALGEIVSDDYLMGYLDGAEGALRGLRQRLGIDKSTERYVGSDAASALIDDETSTWGLKSIGLVSADRRRLGKGIRIGVLDTGFNHAHPDFLSRNILSESFIDGETAEDLNGHGTHCLGTIGGPVAPRGVCRYGIASEADFYVGKVLSNSGRGTADSVLRGIERAIQVGCQVISLSLGSPTRIGSVPSPAYTRLGEIALSKGTLIIAAAGNESNRPFSRSPIGSPANVSSIMSVAAHDPAGQAASFSCAALDPRVKGLDISAPGVAVLSSYPTSLGGYKKLNGTSMATPHVAGVAAVIAGENAELRGRSLWSEIVERCAKVPPAAEIDLGKGLLRA